MRILSHRGFWNFPDEKNTLAAFERSFRAGFGIEIDVRDALGQLVVSHDIPSSDALRFEEVLQLHQQLAPDVCLAVNIKSDGLQSILKDVLQKYEVRDYFVFDMSVPDMLGYARIGLSFFTRQSDLELQPVLYPAAAGVWLDAISVAWLSEPVIAGHQTAGKRICLVSPELHGRAHLAFWTRLRSMNQVRNDSWLLCTDYPEEARRFFHE